MTNNMITNVKIMENKSIQLIKEIKGDALKYAQLKDFLKIDGEIYQIKERCWIQEENTGLLELKLYVELHEI